MSKTASELVKAEKDLKNVVAHTKENDEKRDKIDEEIEEVNVQLREARDDKKKSKEGEKVSHPHPHPNPKPQTKQN